jgi:hypothetical protein
VEDTFQVSGVDRAVAAANRAAVLLAGMDREKAAAGVAFWHPGLLRRAGNGEAPGD